MSYLRHETGDGPSLDEFRSVLDALESGLHDQGQLVDAMDGEVAQTAFDG